MWSRALFVLLLCLSASGCSLTGQSARTREAGVEGTYQIMICQGTCGADNVLVRGRLVLETDPYSLDSVPELARIYFRRYEPYLLISDAERAPNACFHLELTRRSRTYAGISPVGLTRWSVAEDSDSLEIPLYHSPDAGYFVRITIRARQLRGHGRSWGGHGEAAAFPIDSIVGRRVGPPDRSLCFRAAEAEAAELRNRP